LVQTHGPYHWGYSKNTRVQKCLDTTHRKAGVRWYTQTTLEMNRHWSKAPVLLH